MPTRPHANRCLRPVAVFIAALVMATMPLTVPAQLNGRLAEKPIGVGYARDLEQVKSFEYMESLAKRLEIGDTMFQQIPRDQLEGFRPKVDVPVMGASWFMVQGLIPSFETVYFQEVADAADAKRLVESRSNMFGPNATVETPGEGCYRLTNRNSWTTPVPEGFEPEQYIESVKANNARGSRQLQQSAELVEKDGKQMVEHSWTRTECYRFHDNLLFSTDFEELWEMDLPSRASFTSSVSSSNDMGVEAFFDRIPMGIKQLGWNMLNSTAGTQMQRRDEEEQTVADLRKSALNVGLEIVRSIMFDVEQTNGWFRFATDQDQSVRGELNFETRRNSALTKQLEDVSSGASRFAPILKDDAAATFHFCFRMSEDSGELPSAAAAWLKNAIDDATNSDPVMVEAAGVVAESLNAFASHRTAEAFAKVGWTKESGGVVYGGLQVDDNPRLLQAIYTMATSSSDTPAAIKEAFQLSEFEGVPAIRIVLPEGDAELEQLAQSTSLRFSHIYMMHQNSCLWIAAGGEDAANQLLTSISRCSSAGLAARTPLISANIDIDKWLSYPQDDPTGIGGFLTWMDQNSWLFPPSPMSISFRFGGSLDDKPTPLLKPCIDLGGETDAQFSVIADRSGVRVSARMGEVIANYYVARMIDSQDGMMRRNQRMAEQQRQKAQQETEKAQPE